MPLANAVETDLLNLLFVNTNIANLGDVTGVRGSTAAGSLYAALHTASPGEAGDQTTSEATYTSYARVAIVRSVVGFTVAADQVVNAALVSFPACTGGSNTILFWSLGFASAGASEILAYGALATLTPEAFTAVAATDLVTSPNMTFVVDDRVTFFAREGGSLPTGITEGTVYFIKTAPGSNTYTISTTSGGATLDITADGAGLIQKVIPLAISNGHTPQFTAGQLAILLG